jgi:hypothetical protein
MLFSEGFLKVTFERQRRLLVEAEKDERGKKERLNKVVGALFQNNPVRIERLHQQMGIWFRRKDISRLPLLLTLVSHRRQPICCRIGVELVISCRPQFLPPGPLILLKGVFE